MIRTLEIGGRQTGKTHRILMRMLEGENLVYVAPSAADARHAFEMAMTILGDRRETWDDSVVRRFRRRFITWRDAADPRLTPPGTPVVIDNLDMVLDHIFGGNIDTATMLPPEQMTTYRNMPEGNPND